MSNRKFSKCFETFLSSVSVKFKSKRKRGNGTQIQISIRNLTANKEKLHYLYSNSFSYQATIFLKYFICILINITH